MIIQFSQVLRMTKLFQYLNSAEYNGFLPPLDSEKRGKRGCLRRVFEKTKTFEKKKSEKKKKKKFEKSVFKTVCGSNCVPRQQK